MTDSVFETNRCLSSYIRIGKLNRDVIDVLLPKGIPLAYEKTLWDYKSEFPFSYETIKPDREEKIKHNAAVAELVKDAVSFYNSYGGYIIFGVRDLPREVVGVSGSFNVDGLNKRLHAATGHEIDCHINYFNEDFDGSNQKIALLFIPRRSDDTLPAVFRKDAPENPNGKKAYKKGDYYFRRGDECRPASEPDDFSFLCSPNRREHKEIIELPETTVLDNNLGPKDPDLIRFIGREEYLQKLWQWLLERFAPCVLLAGLGGVGKTTIARKFAEIIVTEAPLGFERVIFISAKPKYWRLYKNTTVNALSDDIRFVDTISLLRSLLSELGFIDCEIDPDSDLEELIEQSVNALQITPSFIIIDDIDSLEPEEQHLTFHTILQIIGQTIAKSGVSSRAVLTARLDLGASPSQLMRVKGLQKDEFREYAVALAEEYDLTEHVALNAKNLEKIRIVTDGSPIFTSSIFRLLALGEKLDDALRQWRGSDGEDVRRFAFEREISRLSHAQLRTLYALCELRRTSLVELEHVLEISRSLLRDCIDALRQYHLLIRENDVPAGGYDIAVPNSIILMQPVVQSHVSDFNKIRSRCGDTRKNVSAKSADIGAVIYRVVAHWKQDEKAEALSVAEWASKRYKKHPDLECILGRAYLRAGNDRSVCEKADAAFRNANELGCKRPELFEFWIEAKKILRDWHGIIKVSTLADRKRPSPDNVLNKAYAYQELGEEARRRGDLRSASENYLNGAKEIKAAFDDKRAKGRVNELLDLKSNLARAYFDLISLLNSAPRDSLYIWLAAIDIFNLMVRPASILQAGMRALNYWWSSIEGRHGYDDKAVRLLDVQLSSLEKIAKELHDQRPEEELFRHAYELLFYLQERMKKYQEENN